MMNLLHVVKSAPVFGALAFLSAVATSGSATAQQDEESPTTAEVTAHVYKPLKLEPTEERVAQLQVPDGFSISKFAEGLGGPRMFAVADDGTLYVTRPQPGDVVMLRDTDGDGAADVQETVAEEPFAHGIALHDGKMYVATVQEVFVGDLQEDGTVGELRPIVQDLPVGGQHPNRTLGVGPDNRLYITVGSLANAYSAMTTDLTATVLRAGLDGSDLNIFAKGLRNTLGIAWHPRTGEMWGMDHGIDWLGDEVPPEELNRLKEGAHYGWPWRWGNGNNTPQTEPPPGDIEEFESPVLTYTAHAAPMQLAFYEGDMFPEEYRNDAFNTMRGSWNRRPPSGYEVVRIRFDDQGQPEGIEPFLTGFLIEQPDGEFGYIARPVGCAVAGDGALLVGDDINGVIYRVAYEE